MTDKLVKLLEQAALLDKELVGEYMRMANECYADGDIEEHDHWKDRMRELWLERRAVDHDLKILKGEL